MIKLKHINLIDEDSQIQQARNLEIQIDQELCNIQEKLQLGNTLTEIYFPHKPYDVQIQYMEKVVQTLDKKSNGLLESPTGTGKTLCLLCSSMGWLQKYRKEQQKYDDAKNLKIIYASRTHAQLKQVAQELKRTVYRPNISMIGSRDQYCLMNLQNRKGNALIQACRNLIKRKQCVFYNKDNIQSIAATNSKLINTLEESKQFGSNNKVCPYYFERERLMNADLILLPYNYLLDDEFSKIVDVTNSIIIFDEAHNIPSTAENGQSFFMNDNIVAEAKKELERWLNQLKEMPDFFLGFQQALSQKSLLSKGLVEYDEIAETIKTFSIFLQNLQTASYFNHGQYNEQCKVFEAQQIFNFLYENTSIQKQNKGSLFQNGINIDNISIYISFCQAIISYMSEVSPHEGSNFQSWTRFVVNLDNFMQDDIDNEQLKYSDFYKLAVIKNKQNEISLNMWCLDPSLAFKKLMQNNIHSIILTSGTLSPMESWQSELQINFQIQLSNRHVIDIKNNVRAFQHQDYDFSFNNRGDDNQIKNLGLTILNFSQIIKGGIIVVFSSYGLMQNIQKKWNTQGLIQQLNQVKKCLWEEQGSASFHNTLEVFKQNVSKGAILFAVHRGKVAEGIDLSDDLCRAVFLIGIPYPPLEDQKIKLKKEYLDKLLKKNRQGLSSNDWYNQQAVRATNQAIGRVLRHINDYGAIFLCDKRFQWSNMKAGISKWVQPAIQSWKTDNDIIQNLTLFFQRQNPQQNVSNIQNQQNHQCFEVQLTRQMIQERQNSSEVQLFQIQNQQSNSQNQQNHQFSRVLLTRQMIQERQKSPKVQLSHIAKQYEQQIQQRLESQIKVYPRVDEKQLQLLNQFSKQKLKQIIDLKHDASSDQQKNELSDQEYESYQKDSSEQSEHQEESQEQFEYSEESSEQFEQQEASEQSEHYEESQEQFEYSEESSEQFEQQEASEQSEHYEESQEQFEYSEESSDDNNDPKQKKIKYDNCHIGTLYQKRKNRLR